LRQRARREDEAEVGLGAGQVENGEGERDVGECVADERGRPAEEEVPEAALSERAEVEALEREHGEIVADASDALEKSGADGARTRDLESATLALSQLSYGPLVPSKCSGEIEVVRPVDTPPLVVAGRSNAELDRRPFLDKFDWEQEAAIKVHGIRGNHIHLIRRVRRLLPTRSSSTERVTANDEHLVYGSSPLALDTQKP
jgi:hypothetical protein